ncbi:MAG: hypothetical protein SFW66_00790 [Gammaproteobacteria bacterium]|nr:hypothetical protein [Gammaproteobacteria bacterium]
MQKIFIALSFLLISVFSTSVYSFNNPLNCTPAAESNDPGFCPSFKAAVECYCVAKGLPDAMCKNTDLIYEKMVATWGSLETACRMQKDSTQQECMNDWICYRSGGTDTQGRSCSSTGKSCESSFLYG